MKSGNCHVLWCSGRTVLSRFVESRRLRQFLQVGGYKNRDDEKETPKEEPTPEKRDGKKLRVKLAVLISYILKCSCWQPNHGCWLPSQQLHGALPHSHSCAAKNLLLPACKFYKTQAPRYQIRFFIPLCVKWFCGRTHYVRLQGGTCHAFLGYEKTLFHIIL